MGIDEGQLEEVTDRGRFYRRTLNLKYISSRRNLFDFIKREKRHLIEEYKEKRTEDQTQKDEKRIEGIKNNIKQANESIGELSYIRNSTKSINTELSDLSKHHESQEIVFDTGLTDVSHLMDKIELSSRSNGQFMGVGGDGRNNQIYLALWSAKNKVNESNEVEFTIFCIEEPESHLHPHQQRQISKYFVNKVSSQLLLTTHSPQIASEFSPDSLVRLFFNSDNYDSKAGGDGVSSKINDSVVDFGYRLNILSAESFFSNTVILVEGTSELILLKALSDALGDIADKQNVSVISVEGIGFKPYIKLYESMELKWLLKTDNDIFKVQGKNKYWMSGLSRAFSILESVDKTEHERIIKEQSIDLKEEFDTSESALAKAKSIIEICGEKLENFGIFLSNIDLENDLMESEIQSKLSEFYGDGDSEAVIKQMQQRKAENLFGFLAEHQKELLKISKDDPS
ncbi:AAA family ATPase, partial [Candidatus Dojkabacteria bacterium]|nr:AAA family ATPase [Candidatus Dojkabacteria bacterium]